jgi:hypothetical protein
MAIKMKVSEIVKYNGVLGELVKDDKGNFLFHPVNFGRYYYNELDIVTENDLEETTFDEKVDYLKKEFSWGEVLEVHSIAEYIIFKYKEKKSNHISDEAYEKEDHISYHSYTNFKDDSMGYATLDQAIIGVISSKYDGSDRAFGYICRMLDMDNYKGNK